jgi:hypothetical protein
MDTFMIFKCIISSSQMSRKLSLVAVGATQIFEAGA